MNKPWDKEPTPFKDRLVDDYGDFFISQTTVENLERRLRHAERLLEKSWKTSELEDVDQLHNDVLDHLKAARQEDGK